LVYRPALAHCRRVSVTLRSASSMAPGWTSMGSVDGASPGAFRPGDAGFGFGERRGVRDDAFRFDAGGLLRGAMSGPGR